jgi:hypothetical protein
MQIASKKRWFRAAIIGAAIFAVWFTLGVLTFNEDTNAPELGRVTARREGAPSPTTILPLCFRRAKKRPQRMGGELRPS